MEKSNETPHCAESIRKSQHSPAIKQNLTHRLNRIEGQVRGINRMIENDTYCDDIITQLSATQSALNSVAAILLDGHLKGCVKSRLADGDESVLDELVTTMTKLMRK